MIFFILDPKTSYERIHLTYPQQCRDFSIKAFSPPIHRARDTKFITSLVNHSLHMLFFLYMKKNLFAPYFNAENLAENYKHFSQMLNSVVLNIAADKSLVEEAPCKVDC